jgi:type IV secretion system protein VirD4
MLRAAARDPLWAFLAVLLAPFRLAKPLIALAFLALLAFFVIFFGGRLILEPMGFHNGSIPVGVLDLLAIFVMAAIAVRFLVNPLISHFGDSEDDTHGSARLATEGEKAPLLRAEAGLLVGRDPKTRKTLRYDGPAHLLSMAPTRTGKGVGTIIPNL